MAQMLDVNNVKTSLKRLTNENLKRILKEENLPVSGVKATLQGRMMECTFYSLLSSRPLSSPIHSPSCFFYLLPPKSNQRADVDRLAQSGSRDAYDRVKRNVYITSGMTPQSTTPPSYSNTHYYNQPTTTSATRPAMPSQHVPSMLKISHKLCATMPDALL